MNSNNTIKGDFRKRTQEARNEKLRGKLTKYTVIFDHDNINRFGVLLFSGTEINSSENIPNPQAIDFAFALDGKGGMKNGIKVTKTIVDKPEEKELDDKGSTYDTNK